LQWDITSSNMVEVYITPHQFLIAGIDPQSSTPQNAKKLKRYLLFLLTQISTTHSFFAGPNDQLLIEIYPDQTGGAAVRFIIKRDNQKLCRPLVFCFNDSDTLIEAAVKLLSVHGHRLFKSDLYKCDALWLLIISLIDPNINTAKILLSEYGFFISDKSETAALIKEHCKPILLDKAADTISLYFS